MTPTDKRKRAREVFKEVAQHKAKADRLTVELMSHPDATPEQFADVHRVACSARDTLEDVITRLRTVFPDRGGFMSADPWHAQEYDKYYRPSRLEKQHEDQDK